MRFDGRLHQTSSELRVLAFGETLLDEEWRRAEEDLDKPVRRGQAALQL